VIVSWGIPASGGGASDTTVPTLSRFLPEQPNKFLKGGSSYTVIAGAFDNVGVVSVLMQNVINGASLEAEFTGTNRWEASVPVVRGRSNYITAVASDAAGNDSATLPFIIHEVGTNTGSSTATTSTTLKAVGGNP
jgi:hypothetical protein